jgi:tRNA(Ile)-lysidine synthase TilS/MesJ
MMKRTAFSFIEVILTETGFETLIKSAPNNLSIFDSLLKARSMLERHRKAAVSVSGGSDSDTIMDLLELIKSEACELIYMFFDTGR